MSDQDRLRWDERFRATAPNYTPSALVAQFVPPAPPHGHALDVACGAGRHALYLAELGYQVDAVDISPVGLALLATKAARHEVTKRIRPIQADLDVWRPSPSAYHVVIQSLFFDRALLAPTLAAVQPGGLLILEAFNTTRLVTQPGFNPAYALAPGELATACAHWEILHLDERVGEAGDRSQIVARRLL